MSAIRPLGNKVAIKRIKQENVTTSGIYIPDLAVEKPDQGEIVAAGPGTHNERGDFVAMSLKVGDIVIFNKNSGSTVKLDGEEFLILTEPEVFAVVR